MSQLNNLFKKRASDRWVGKMLNKHFNSCTFTRNQAQDALNTALNASLANQVKIFSNGGFLESLLIYDEKLKAVTDWLETLSTNDQYKFLLSPGVTDRLAWAGNSDLVIRIIETLSDDQQFDILKAEGALSSLLNFKQHDKIISLLEKFSPEEQAYLVSQKYVANQFANEGAISIVYQSLPLCTETVKTQLIISSIKGFMSSEYAEDILDQIKEFPEDQRIKLIIEATTLSRNSGTIQKQEFSDFVFEAFESISQDGKIDLLKKCTNMLCFVGKHTDRILDILESLSSDEQFDVLKTPGIIHALTSQGGRDRTSSMVQNIVNTTDIRFSDTFFDTLKTNGISNDVLTAIHMQNRFRPSISIETPFGSLNI